MLKLAYGYTAEDKNDPILSLIEKALEHVPPATNPAGFYVNQFPFRKFPYVFIIYFLCLNISSTAYTCLVSRCILSPEGGGMEAGLLTDGQCSIQYGREERCKSHHHFFLLKPQI